MNEKIEYPIKDAKRLRRSFLIILYVIPLQFFSHYLADNNSDNAILYVLLIVLSLLLTLVMITAPAFELGVLTAKLEDFEKKSKVDSSPSNPFESIENDPAVKKLIENDPAVKKLREFIRKQDKKHLGKKMKSELERGLINSRDDQQHLGKEMKAYPRCRKES